MSMQTLTWDVDAAAVAGNSDALTLSWMEQSTFYHAIVALSLQIEIYNVDRTI